MPMNSLHLTAIEPLEPRIAPASVTIYATTKTATWTDWDGDLITLKWTTVTAPSFDFHDDGLGVTVDRINLSSPAHQNIGLTVTIKAAGGGDGFVDIGRLGATGVAIKSLSAPKASFAELDAGDGNKSIGTLSIYALGMAASNHFTNAGGDGLSALSGIFTSFKLTGDLNAGKLTLGKLDEASGSIAIGGSVRGDSLSSHSSVNGYLVFSGSKLASFTLGGSIVGGNTANDGRVELNATLSTVTVKGSILGGEASSTGTLRVSTVSTLSVAGSLVGSSGISSATLSADRVTTLTLGGSVIGGSVDYAGYVSLGTLGKGTIGGSVKGGTGYLTGLVSANSTKSFTINGSIYGGTKGNTGLVGLGDTGTFVMKGGIFGNEATTADVGGEVGRLRLGDVTSVSILGGIHTGRSASGLALPVNGALFIDGNAGTVTIKGGVTGNTETKALVVALGTAVKPGDYTAIKSLSITGDVSYATIATGHGYGVGAAIGNAENPDAGLGSLTVTGNWFHSSLLVGINDVSENGAESSDTRSPSDATRLAKVGLIKIGGRILDDPNASGYSGFIAEKIAKITVGGATVFQTGGNPMRYLDTFDYVIVREL